ncbi:MAG: Holliday junction DNA helicase RuvB C-terminal domain-containing protein, partial [Pseudomonadota bacterium]
RLNFYTVDELERVVLRGASVLGIDMVPDGAREIAKRARGTPRIAGRLLRRVRDFAAVSGATQVTSEVADNALTRLEVDRSGLDAMDHRYMRCIGETYTGGPVGIETLAAALAEPRDAIEDIIEPYLLQNAFVQRTPRGRMLGPRGWSAIGLTAPKTAPSQTDLFGGDSDDS